MEKNSQKRDLIKSPGEVERGRILNLPPEKILEEVLNSENPLALVRSMDEQDLYFLVHDIGPADALPLIALASYEQKEFMLDMEVWDRDRMNLEAFEKWFEIMAAADIKGLVRLAVKEEKIPLFEYFLNSRVDVLIREHDQDPSDFPDDFITMDGMFYFRVRKQQSVPDQAGQEDVPPSAIEKFFTAVAEYDLNIFHNLLLEIPSVIRAETEEEEYRKKNVRLAEKGFVPFEEALGIYGRLSAEELLLKRVRKYDPLGPAVSYPRLHSRMIKKAGKFSDALVSLKPKALESFACEFASLCNKIAAADERKVQNRNDLAELVKKACGYLNIGIEEIIRIKDARPGQIIGSYLLEDIFRVGYSLAMELKWSAAKWFEGSWAKSRGLGLHFFDEYWFGILGGLFLDRPLFFDNFATGVMYREFEALSDIKRTEEGLKDIIAIDDLFASFGIDVEAAGRFITYKKLLLTLWARHEKGLDEKGAPLDLETFKSFFTTIFDRQEGVNRLKETVRHDFGRWIEKRIGHLSQSLQAKYSRIFEMLFNELEEEYAGVSPEKLDPRFIRLFWVKYQAE